MIIKKSNIRQNVNVVAEKGKRESILCRLCNKEFSERSSITCSKKECPLK